MNIKVAFDVSVLGLMVGLPDPRSGIARVAEELLFELSATNGIDLTAVAITGVDPLFDSVKSLAYMKSVAPRAEIPFTRSFGTRLGFETLYETVFGECLAGETLPKTKHSNRLLLMKGLRSLLYRLSHTYHIERCFHSFDSRQYDVYHSPNLWLPPRTLTDGVERVLTIYDLIPLTAPHFVTPSQTAGQKLLLDRIDFDRDWITCISDYVKDEFCSYSGMSPERVFVTPLAAADHFRPVADPEAIAAVRRRYRVPEGDYFLTLAAPQPRKNLTHLIRCFFRLLEERPGLDASLALAGSTGQGWLYDEIFEAAGASPKFRDRLVFTGFVADEDLADLYSGATAFVFPSLYEGFGLPPLEAMACGTPVITANTTSLPEVVGNAAIMVDPVDEDALVNAMWELLTDESLRLSLSRKGLDRAKEFSWKKCAEETAKVYRIAAGRA